MFLEIDVNLGEQLAETAERSLGRDRLYGKTPSNKRIISEGPIITL